MLILFLKATKLYNPRTVLFFYLA